MQINYNKHIVFKPQIEEKTERHYDFIKSCFDAYISLENFLKRKDLFVVVIRNANHSIVGLCLLRKTLMKDERTIYHPTSYLPYKTKIKLFKSKKKIKVKQWNNVEVKKYNVYRIMYTLVDPYFRGQGRNQELLNFVYDYVKSKRNSKYLVANIRESNKISIKSFEKNGFVIDKRTTKPYSNGEKKIRVIKNIKRRKYKKRIKT